MTEPPRDRIAVALHAAVPVVLAAGALFVALHLAVVRPAAYPAGLGLTLEGAPIAGALADPTALRLARPPDLTRMARGLGVAAVAPSGPAALAGVRVGDRVLRITDGSGQTLDVQAAARASDAGQLASWRAAWWLDVRRTVTVTTADSAGVTVERTLVPRWYPDVPADTASAWVRRHLGGAVQMVVLLAAAFALVLMRVRGRTAALMTLALVVNVAMAGALVGAEAWLPALVREPMIGFGWLFVPFGFPVIAWTVLAFPTPSPLLARWPRLPFLLVALVSPLVVSNALAAAYLAGADAVAPALGWFAWRPWLWPASFVVALLANLAIVVEGVGRYRRNPDPNERRRIQMVVYTGVPAALAWAIAEGGPLVVGAVTGRAAQPPWLVTAALNLVMLLPAVGIPYAVAVKHVFSPRTVLRRSLQYALARRTLTALAVLPAVPLVLSLVLQRDRSLAAIVTGQPFFYATGIGVLVLARRYRDAAERWLDRRFFRAEYDAREILMSLAGRMPFETDPADLVALVIQQLNSALHPASVAVLAALEPGRFDAVGASPATPPALPAGGGLPNLLTWSREPLDVFLDDESSGAARLPPGDRAWLAAAGVNLLVPMLTGDPANPTLVGAMALGPKQSEEPYAPEDRRLLSAIAAQLAVSLDVSRLRGRATALQGLADAETTRLDLTPVLGCCPVCQRIVPLTSRLCPDDQAALAPVPGLPAVVDGKYRVDAAIGRGGMGEVFRARDVRLDRDVAVKVVRAELLSSADARARFRREAQAVARLQHPAVVGVHDYGTLPNGAAFLVMEYVRGASLRQRLRDADLGPDEVVRLLVGIAGGVQAAHDAGVFHRDLKPENVLLPETGLGPKVLDFGVAKVAGGPNEAGTTMAGTAVVGTPAYMAPEQLRGQPVDGAADVYSLGVMAFEMLTGRLPFAAVSLADLAVAHAAGTVPDTDAVPPLLRAVVISALSADPRGRPPSPAAFAAALATGQSGV